MMRDGTVIYTNDETVNGWSALYSCPSGEGNVVSEIVLGFPAHIGHEAAVGNQTCSVRCGASVTAGEFFENTGCSDFDELLQSASWDGPVSGLVPNVLMKDNLPDMIDLSKGL